ncbi:DUF2004 domain-containing protein [Brevibacillus gelatini]|uniref:DUF6985 domain-containing protein n=1 Tax=Brevibacillus gelatini TaxID=1655277 RepID=UPI003D818B17
MKIIDPIFGCLEYNYSWFKDTAVLFFGKETEITLMIDGEADGKFDEEQYEAYQALMKRWEQLHESFLDPIFKYYQQKRHDLGYDIAQNENYPLVEKADQILEMITLEGIIVPYGDIEEGRDIGILFTCTWDQENGLGVRLLNEVVVEVGYQDIVM